MHIKSVFPISEIQIHPETIKQTPILTNPKNQPKIETKPWILNTNLNSKVIQNKTLDFETNTLILGLESRSIEKERESRLSDLERDMTGYKRLKP